MKIKVATSSLLAYGEHQARVRELLLQSLHKLLPDVVNLKTTLSNSTDSINHFNKSQFNKTMIKLSCLVQLEVSTAKNSLI